MQAYPTYFCTKFVCSKELPFLCCYLHLPRGPTFIPLRAIFGASYLRLAIIDFISTCISCSPIGEIFRARLRQFPSLVNCCTIDWFSAWPKEALRSVASTFLGEIPELDESSAMEGLVCPDFYHMNYIFQVRIGLLQRDRT